MKQTPELDLAQRCMRPGIISLHGFLGADRRSLRAILEDDDQRVAALGLTHGAIAERMRYLTAAGRRGLGSTVVVEEIYEVRVDEARGVLPCPWPHPGVFPKAIVFLQRLDTNESISWAELQIHLIGAHGFYEGKGSPYRLSPEKLKRVLGLEGGAAPDSSERPARD